MKINIKAKGFEDKANLSGSLNNLLKKPLTHITLNRGTALPFHFESGYFEDSSGFLSIGESKDLEKIFKKRTKGQGVEGKIDKKKVAAGTVSCLEDGSYQFIVNAGTMKMKEAKEVIKSIPNLKKFIASAGFTILKGAPVPEEEPEPTEETPTDETASTSTEENSTVKDLRAKLEKMKSNLGQLSDAVGRIDGAKIQSNLERFKTTMQSWWQDITGDSEQEALLKELEENAQEIEDQMANGGTDNSKPLTPETRAKVNDNVKGMTNALKSFAQQLEGLSV